MSHFAYHVAGGQAEKISAEQAIEASGGLVWIHLATNNSEAQDWLAQKAGLEDYLVDALTATESRPRCDAVGDGALSYSNGTKVAIDENAIDEAKGTCGSTPIDFNANGSIDATPFARDLTQDTSKTVLTDWNDWSAINLTKIKDADGASPSAELHDRVVVEQPVPVP